ncbi:MAG: hypothetical protein GY952_05380 [Rhodobacteraceae bacterium]|nr:hypothetical protein [Paracoccaceae bacterium]
MSLLLSGTAVAQSGLNGLPLAQHCLEPSGSIEKILDWLEWEGWQVVSNPNQTSMIQLAWAGMPRYFSGDSGGATLESVFEIKKKAAAGLLRKKQLPTNQTRIMVRDPDGVHQETLIVMWRQPTPTKTEVQCIGALVDQSVDDPATDSSFGEGLPDFHRLTAPDLPKDEPFQRVDFIVLNRRSLENQLGVAVPVDAIVETFSSFSTVEN